MNYITNKLYHFLTNKQISTIKTASNNNVLILSNQIPASVPHKAQSR